MLAQLAADCFIDRQPKTRSGHPTGCSGQHVNPQTTHLLGMFPEDRGLGV